MIEFGTKHPQQKYIQRPGAYAVIVQDGLYAIVKNPKSCFLLGGGLEGQESPEEALHREVMEEVGMSIRIDKKIGVATQYIYVPEVPIYIAKEGHFYLATFLDQATYISEDNHELLWFSKEEAIKKLLHKSHQWALEQALS